MLRWGEETRKREREEEKRNEGKQKREREGKREGGTTLASCLGVKKMRMRTKKRTESGDEEQEMEKE